MARMTTVGELREYMMRARLADLLTGGMEGTPESQVNFSKAMKAVGVLMKEDMGFSHMSKSAFYATVVGLNPETSIGQRASDRFEAAKSELKKRSQE